MVEVQILGLNDFHGNLEPPGGSSGRVGTVEAGGAEYLATHIRQLEEANRNTIVVSAGDLIGASPLLSALFHDEPTVEAMNQIGLDLNAVGNHEFDEGVVELRRMVEGGCHPADGCLDGDGFAGADFEFLAANVVDETTGDHLFAPYVVKYFDGAKVAFIGMTLEGTPTIVSQSGIAGWRFLDEADTVNQLLPEIRRHTEAVVVLLHEGGQPAAFYPNGCPGISGPIVDIVNRTDDEVDLFITGHTHQAYNCVIDGRPVTSAYSFGRLVTDIDLRVDRASKDVVGIAVNNRTVTRDVTADAGITSRVQPFGNNLVTLTLTGAQLEHVLEQQFCGINHPANGGFARVLLPSSTLRYTYAQSGITADCATSNAVDPAGVTIAGAPLDLTAAYRVSVNSFLADGGDGFTALRDGTDRVGGPVDVDAFEQYLQDSGTLAPPARDRIQRLP